MLIVLAGLPGVDKPTFAKCLAATPGSFYARPGVVAKGKHPAP